jgi:hypothetical protein
VGKASCVFTASDVARALRAAKKAGVPVRLEIDLQHHVLKIIPAESDKASESNLTPDDELERWRKKKNAG